MYEPTSLQNTASETRSTDDAPTLFGRTMAYVAVTTALFALATYLCRNLAPGWGWFGFIGAFACLIAMNFAARASTSLTVALLFAFGFLIGMGTAPTVSYYAGTDPQALWQAGGATALFIVGLGAAGYGSRRDLSALARLSFWALVALVAFGVVTIFVHMPSGALIYAAAGLVIFAGLTVIDFQRLRTTRGDSSAPLLAASIFLDGLNVFLFFLNIFDRRR